jgi:hypothetical protein
MTPKKKEVLNNLLAIYYELENIYSSINLSYEDFFKEIESNLERKAIMVHLGRYFLIRYCAFCDEVNYQLTNHCGDLEIKLKENIATINILVNDHYQIKGLRNTVLAHNNRNQKHILLTRAELSLFKAPESISEYGDRVCKINCVNPWQAPWGLPRVDLYIKSNIILPGNQMASF